jgi:hypothetical protein
MLDCRVITWSPLSGWVLLYLELCSMLYHMPQSMQTVWHTPIEHPAGKSRGRTGLCHLFSAALLFPLPKQHKWAGGFSRTPASILCCKSGYASSACTLTSSSVVSRNCGSSGRSAQRARLGPAVFWEVNPGTHGFVALQAGDMHSDDASRDARSVPMLLRCT